MVKSATTQLLARASDFAEVEREDHRNSLVSPPLRSQVKEWLPMASSTRLRVVVEVNCLAFDRTHCRPNQCKSGHVALKGRTVKIGVVQIPVSLHGRAPP